MRRQVKGRNMAAAAGHDSQTGERAACIAHNLRLMRELREVLGALEAAGVAALVLKGAALQATVYNIDERVMHDVDLLVPIRQRRAAAAVLVSLGLSPMMGPGRPLGTRLAHSRGFGHASGVQMDLHTALASPLRWRVPIDGLFSRALPCDIDGFSGRRLSNEDLLLHLALNLVKDDLVGFARCAEDMDRVLHALTVNWPAVVARAGQWGCRTALWLALELTCRRRQGAVPAEVLASLSPGAGRRYWLDLIVDLDTEPPNRLAARGRRLSQVAFVPVMSDRPLNGALATGRFALIRAIDALLTRVPGVGG